jgi:hypothetical protein
MLTLASLKHTSEEATEDKEFNLSRLLFNNPTVMKKVLKCFKQYLLHNIFYCNIKMNVMWLIFWWCGLDSSGSLQGHANSAMNLWVSQNLEKLVSLSILSSLVGYVLTHAEQDFKHPTLRRPKSPNKIIFHCLILYEGLFIQLPASQWLFCFH